MKNKPMSAYKVKITLAVTAVFILAITLIMVYQSGAQEPTQSIGDLIGVSSANNLTVAATPKIAKPKLASVDSLLIGLVSRLKQHPDDVQGWVLLASSYHHLHRIDDANKAFEQATLLGYKGKPPYIPNTSNSHRPFSPVSSPLPQNSFLQQYLKNNQRSKHNSHDSSASNQKLATNANSITELKLHLSLEPDLSETVGVASER